MIGKAMTVLGPVEVDKLGTTITHEHVLVYMTHMMKEPDEASRKRLFWEPMSLDILGAIRYAGAANADNFQLTDIDVAVEEVNRFKNAGGNTIVDVTSIGLGRDPEGLAQVARRSGLNIVMGASYYVDETHSVASNLGGRSESDIANEIIRDVVDGVGATGVHAGIIGEVGCSWPLTDNERKVLRASASAQRATGAPLTIHPGRFPTAPREIASILADAGADLTRTVFCHLDRTTDDKSHLIELAQMGCMLEYDLFGFEHSNSRWKYVIDMPNDAGRIRWLSFLIAEGFVDQLLISHDICLKDKLARYGGHGYAHILENVLPMMRHRGIDAGAIESILVRNPKRLLAFAEPRPN